MSKILVTGANSFIGSLLVSELSKRGHSLHLAVRKIGPDGGPIEAPLFTVGEIGPATDWSTALRGCDAVVHIAGQTPSHGVSEEQHRLVNDLGTRRLVEQAVQAGVGRFLFVSSIAASSRARSAPADSGPQTAYGRTKLAGERHVEEAAGQGLVPIIVRPPLVYGAGAKGSWHALQRLAASGLPLPFGAVRNRRSIIARENLVDALALLLAQPDDAEIAGVHSIADEEAVSLEEIVTWLREGMGLKKRLFAVPPRLLELPLRAAGRDSLAASLFGDLVIDSQEFSKRFGWKAPLKPREAITQSGRDFIRR
jgi:UDP-glucose 4-epimerase